MELQEAEDSTVLISTAPVQEVAIYIKLQACIIGFVILAFGSWIVFFFCNALRVTLYIGIGDSKMDKKNNWF